LLDSLFNVENRVVLITGASGGLGEMIASGFVRRGARAYIVGRSADRCDAAVEKLRRHGVCRAIVADVGTPEGRAAIVSAIDEAEGAVHTLVNNAGTITMSALEEMSEPDWDKDLSVNLKAPFFLAQQLLPMLRKGASPDWPATVINIGSIGGLRVRPRENYAYQASKAALHHVTAALARRLGPEHISVNAVAPGIFPSNMTQLKPGALLDEVVKTIPLRRVGAADDMAGIALFLASRAGAYVTGAVVPVDGGASI
jgi:NAD(P)-dependent dehydrogenase (short-subunit alcohol dehydrogenase family)